MTVKRGSFSQLLRRLRRVRRRYSSNADGATAIEFGMVSIPFLALIFGILELALVFFTSAVLTQAMSDTGRLVRIGSFQGCGAAPEFKKLVCNRMKNLMNCEGNLRIDLATESSFQSVSIDDPGMSGLDPDDDTQEIKDGDYADTGPSVPVVMRGTFYYPLIMPNFMTRLENIPNSRRHAISVATAFRTEPFPAGLGCDADLAKELGKT